MTSRRLIRIKVLQLLYAYSKKENATLAEIERDILQSMKKSTDLYYETLLLLTEVRRKAFLKIDAARNHLVASEEDLHPNMRFVENPVFDIIEKNRKFRFYINNNLISWENSPETILYFYNKFIGWEKYRQYMSRPEMTFADHKQLLLDFFSEILIQDDLFFQTMEEKNIYWNDDFELVLSVVYKTLWHIQEDMDEESELLYPIYKQVEDTEFARTLMRKTFLGYEQNIATINEYIQNWEIERISEMDRLIMACAIAELKNFPTIPIKVTLDEYIEISKTYSSPKSSSFINGVLDKIVKRLKENHEIIKKGRGLIE